MNSPPLTRDITCSRLYLDGKKYDEAMSDEHPLMDWSNDSTWTILRVAIKNVTRKGNIVVDPVFNHFITNRIIATCLFNFILI